jgi:hypothetical protein
MAWFAAARLCPCRKRGSESPAANVPAPVGGAGGLVRKALLEFNQRAGEVGHGSLLYKPVFYKPVFYKLVFYKPVFYKPVFYKPVFYMPVFCNLCSISLCSNMSSARLLQHFASPDAEG